MKIDIDCGYETLDDPYNYKVSHLPYSKIKIDISVEELSKMKNYSRDTFVSLMRVVRRGCDEVDKGVQVY
jgi:hypothetical protein